MLRRGCTSARMARPARSLPPMRIRRARRMPKSALRYLCSPHSHPPHLSVSLVRSLATELLPVLFPNISAHRDALLPQGAAAAPADGRCAHGPGCLKSSPTDPRAPMSMTGAGGTRAPPLAVGSHLHGRNRPAPASPPSVMPVSSVCFTLQAYVSSV
jgi:hypothetical protein